MSRRRLVAIVSGIFVGGFAIVIVAAIAVITQTRFGLGQVRGVAVRALSGKANGTVYLGAITGNLLSRITIDSVEIRDANDSLFVATGPITVAYDLRNIIDRRLVLKTLRVERPTVYLTRFADSIGGWNFERIFPPQPRLVTTVKRGFGDFITVDSVELVGASITLREPWKPEYYLRTNAQKDSATRARLARTDAEFRRHADGVSRTRHFTDASLSLVNLRLAHPDTMGQAVTATHIGMTISDPPLVVRDAEGTFRRIADSLWMDIPRLVLPASRGSANGKLVWGGGDPTRWALQIEGDTVALRDISWVYAGLPDSGGGHSRITIQSERDPRIIDYILTNMDLRTTGSRVQGAMTFGVGEPVLVIKDLALESSPLDFELIREFGGGQPFPVPWAGQITGSVRGPGGPLDRFQVDDLTFSFADANVPGATVVGKGRGGLDIRRPAETVFHGFALDLSHLDLRTPRFLFPSFLTLGGAISGQALLDSSWMDVRFSDANITHTDTAGPPSRFTGAGRVTMGTTATLFDLALDAAPISLTTFAASYPIIPLRGNYTGPLRMQGTSDSLLVTTELTSPAGKLTYTGLVDVHEPTFGVRGNGTVVDAELATLLDRPDIAPTRLNGTYVVSIVGDSLLASTGTLAIDLAESMIDSVTIHPSRARVTLGDGLMHVDTLVVASTAGTVRGSGDLGIAAPQSGTLRLEATVDSLAGLRRYLTPLLSTDSTIAALDTLRGRGLIIARLTGSFDRLGAEGDISATQLGIGTTRMQGLSGPFNISDLLHPRGTVSLTADELTIGSLQFDPLEAEFTLADTAPTRINVLARSPDDGVVMHVGGAFSSKGDSTYILLDTLSIDAGPDRWALDDPAEFQTSATGLRISSLSMIGNRGGRLAVGGEAPMTGAISLAIAGDSVPLGFLGRLTQSVNEYSGFGNVRLQITGTRAAPLYEGTSTLLYPGVGTFQLDRVDAKLGYASRRLNTEMTWTRHGQGAEVTASLPLDLSLKPVLDRTLADSLHGTFVVDSADLHILEAFTSVVQAPSGWLTANVTMNGTLDKPRLNGDLRVTEGSVEVPQAGILLEHTNAAVTFAGDTIRVDRLSATSGPARGDSVWVVPGSTVVLADFTRPAFQLGLRASNFHAYARRRVADLFIDADLFVRGSSDLSIMTGAVRVNSGALFIPELARKQLVDVSDMLPAAQTALLPKVFANLEVRGVSVVLGNDVWLRSAERDVNVQLTGAVTLDTVTVQTRRSLGGLTARVETERRLALEGSLAADRGTYTLNVGGGVLKRRFEVESGSIEFQGDPDLNPTLDITAATTVRQSPGRGSDVKINVRLYGTLEEPHILVSAADETLPMSESDLYSLILTGNPYYDFGGAGAQQLQTAAAVLLPTVASSIGDRLAGGSFDLVQFEAARLSTFGSEGLRDLLGSSRLALGKQIGPKTFVSGNTSVCKLGGLVSSPEDLIQSLGIKVERELSNNFSAALAVEPGTAGALCRENSPSGRALVSTPRQLGLDLFKSWRF